MLASAGAAAYGSWLHSTYSNLAVDLHIQVRQTVAASFHVVCEILGPLHCKTYLRRIFLDLLCDDCIEIRDPIIANFDKIINVIPIEDEVKKV